MQLITPVRISIFVLIWLAVCGPAKTKADDWRLVFEDNFDRGELGDQWRFYLGQGKIIDGRLYVGPIYDHGVAMINRDFAADVKLEFEAEVDPTKPPCDIACGLGGNEYMGYGYLLQFGAQNNQYNQMCSFLTKDILFVIDMNPPFRIEYHQTYKCTAIKEGRRISYEVNGSKLLETTDEDVLSGPAFGRVCVVSWNGMYVDNVKVYERNIPAPDGPIYIKDSQVLDVGYRWKDRKLKYVGSQALTRDVQQALTAYNERHYKEAFQQLVAVTPPSPQSVAAAAYVLGDLTCYETQSDQKIIAEVAKTLAENNPRDKTATAYALLTDWFSRISIASRDKKNSERIFYLGPEHNPFYYKCMLYRARYHLAQAQESRLPSHSEEALRDFAALRKIWPDHDGLAQLTGEKMPWGKELTHEESEGPAWARHLQEGLARSYAILNWWFSERQAPDGSLGGGWGDDCELLRSWGMPACITTATENAVAGIQRLADGIWECVLHGKGYSDGGDVEHSAEPSADSHPLMILLRYGDPLYVERNLKSAKVLYEVGMGVNDGGGLQFKSCEFGPEGVNLHSSNVGQNLYHCRCMRHLVWLAWYGLPEARDVVLRWADTIREATMAEIGPKPSGYMPYTIFWPSGSIYPPKDRFWLDPKAHAYGVDGGRQWKYHYGLFSAYYFSEDRKFLEPIDRMMDYATMSSGPLNVDESLPRDDFKNLLVDWSRQCRPDITTLYHWLTGSSIYDRNGVSESMRFQIDQDLERYAKTFEPEVEKLRFNWAAKTSEVLQTDRFDMPGDMVFFSAYTGAVTALIEDALIPTLAVTYDTPDLNFAAVVTSTSPERLRIQIYNFNDTTTRIGVRPWQLLTGKYLLNNGESIGEGFRPVLWKSAATLTHKYRGTPIYIDVPSRKTWVVDLRLLDKLHRPAHLPDLAIHSRDVRIDGNDVVVTLHNIGAAEAGPFQVALETRQESTWSRQADIRVEGLPKITNFEPVRREVVLPGSADKLSDTCRVVVDPGDKIEESYKLNNVAEFVRR